MTVVKQRCVAASSTNSSDLPRADAARSVTRCYRQSHQPQLFQQMRPVAGVRSASAIVRRYRSRPWQAPQRCGLLLRCWRQALDWRRRWAAPVAPAASGALSGRRASRDFFTGAPPSPAAACCGAALPADPPGRGCRRSPLRAGTPASAAESSQSRARIRRQRNIALAVEGDLVKQLGILGGDSAAICATRSASPQLLSMASGTTWAIATRWISDNNSSRLPSKSGACSAMCATISSTAAGSPALPPPATGRQNSDPRCPACCAHRLTELA